MNDCSSREVSIQSEKFDKCVNITLMIKVNSKIILVLIAIILILPIIGVWTIVSAGHVGVITRLGAVSRVANPGFTLKIPLIESVISMETRTQKEQVEATAASSDLQEVKSTIALNYHLNGEKAVDVYQNIGINYRERVVDPAMQEAFKATTAQFTAEDLIVKREKVREITLIELKDRLEKYNVFVEFESFSEIKFLSVLLNIFLKIPNSMEDPILGQLLIEIKGFSTNFTFSNNSFLSLLLNLV